MWYALAYSIYQNGAATDWTNWVPSNMRATYGALQSQDVTYMSDLFYENTSNTEKFFFLFLVTFSFIFL